MKKLLLVLFLCSLTSNALAEERMMTCGSEGIFKYVNLSIEIIELLMKVQRRKIFLVKL